MVNATIVVGLLILLTFSSVSSPFGQSEQTEFFSTWYGEKLELKKIEQMLFDCNVFILDSEYDDILLRASFSDNSLWDIEKKPDIEIETGRAEMKSEISEKTKSSDYDEIQKQKLFDLRYKEYEMTFYENCDSLPNDRYELVKQIEVSDSWGLKFNYLRNDTSKIDSGVMKESKYHLDLASGPFLTNMVNLGMMFPFLISAIAEVITNSKKKKDDDQDSDQATNTGKTLMTMGFVSMIIGLCIIAYSFYEASFPYLK